MLFDDLRKANIERCEEVYHSLFTWSPTDWACAVGGECGEALNKVKKLRRLDGTNKNAAKKRLIGLIAEELADTIIYIDLLAARLDIDLVSAIKEKFNKVSEQKGSSVFL